MRIWPSTIDTAIASVEGSKGAKDLVFACRFGHAIQPFTSSLERIV
jgi:hypothetical protein